MAITYTLDTDGSWIAVYETPDPAYRAGLIGRGPTQAKALDNLTRSDESMRTLALLNPTTPDGTPAEAGSTLTFGAIYDALLADGWTVKGSVRNFHGVNGTLAAVLTKPGWPDFLAEGGREEIVFPAYAAAIEVATGLDMSTVPRS